jgi:EAL domain-containing protein (putative c-di-GMP-specific phosphodiesterase class I)
VALSGHHARVTPEPGEPRTGKHAWALSAHRQPAQCLEVELTESMVMEDSEASLSTLKIDRSFVQNTPDDA